MKIAVTGGAGFIGSHIVKAYLDAGHDVFVIDNLSHGSRTAVDARARFYSMDIRDEKLRTVLAMERPDIVSHHATQSYTLQSLGNEQPLADADVHVRGLINILEGCIAAQVHKCIFASNGNSLYGRVDEAQLPLPETTPVCPQHPRDISKIAGEWYVRYYAQAYGLQYTILRYADVYGEVDLEYAHHPLSQFVQTVADGRRPVLRGASHVLRDCIFIDDVVRANLCALTRGDNETVHISAGHGCTLHQLYQVVAILLDSKQEPLQMPSGTLIEPTSIVLDNTRALQVLGWSPEVNMVKGVQRAVTMLQDMLQEPVVTEKRETVLAGRM
jgi:UDP-glucose 4-epimerase